MSSDDLTEKLDEKYDTKPSMTAVLDRINLLGEQLSEKIDKVLADLTGQIMTVRAEMDAGFNLLNKKVDRLAADILQVRAEHSVLEDRVEKLERKPS